MIERAVFSVERGLILKTAIHGKCQIVDTGDTFFGNGQGYTSKVLTDPTWAELMDVFNEQIETTGDIDHVFLEGVDKHPDQSTAPTGVVLYEFLAGS